MSRDMCRGSSLCWSSVLVGVFFANSADKLNMRQPGGHLTTWSFLSTRRNFSIFQFMEGSDPVGCGFTSTPTSGKSFVSLKRTGNKHVPPLFEDEALKYLWSVVHVCTIIWYSREVLSGFERTTICCSPVIMYKMTWISCIPHSAVSSRRFFDLSLLVPNAPFPQKCCSSLVITSVQQSSVLLRTTMFSSHSSPSYLILWHPWQSTRKIISLRWPSPSSVSHP